MTRGYFSFERLDAFRVAREALSLALGKRAMWRGRPGEMGSQLERALVSVVANIAEGAGRESPADQRRHYAIARGSANEAGAMLGVIEAYGFSDEAIRSRIIRVVQMLNRMVKG